MDPSLNTALGLAIENLMNTAMRFDPASRQQLAEITDILAIESTAPALTFYCYGSDTGVHIRAYCEESVTTRLKGSPLSLLFLLKQPGNLTNTGVELIGSVRLLQQWQQLLNTLDIDWEDAISNVLGDITGPMVSDTIRSAFSWASQQRHEKQRLLKEYLTEEIRIIPSKTEMDNLSQQTHEFAMDVDRLQARIDQLRDSINNINSKNENEEGDSP